MSQTCPSRVALVCLGVGAVVLACRCGSSGDAAPTSIAWQSWWDGRKLARADDKPMLVDFTADWCPPCRELDGRTLVDPRVVATLTRNYVPIKIDVDDQAQLAKAFRVRDLPTLVLLAPNGEELSRVTGFQPPTAFRRWLIRNVPRRTDGAADT